MKERKKYFRLFSAVLLTVVYIMAVFPLHSSHDHHHENEHSSLADCKVFHELSDDCHNAIYHGFTTGDCDHEAHFSSSEEPCLSCQFLAKNKTNITEYFYPAEVPFNPDSETFEYPDHPCGDHLQLPSLRGPPPVV